MDISVRLTGVHAREELIAKVAQMSGKAPDENDDKPRKPELPIPRTKKKKKTVVIPQAVKERLIPRRGFANYFYNQLNRDRVWKSHSQYGDFSHLRGEWSIRGIDQDGDDFEFVLREREAFATLADGPHRLDLNRGIESHMRNYVLPDGNVAFGLPPAEGVLLTLAMWRRMLIEQPTQFGEVYYLGTAPLVGTTGNMGADLVDVMVATYDVVENSFYFDPRNGQLSAIESFADSESDPFELLLSNYVALPTVSEDTILGAAAREGDRQMHKVPQQLIIRVGETVLGKYRVESITLGEEEANPEVDLND